MSVTSHARAVARGEHGPERNRGALGVGSLAHLVLEGLPLGAGHLRLEVIEEICPTHVPTVAGTRCPQIVTAPVDNLTVFMYTFPYQTLPNVI